MMIETPGTENSKKKPDSFESGFKYIRKFGVGNPIICNLSQAHDFITFERKDFNYQFSLFAPLYEKGLSVSSISDQTGYALSTIHNCLKKGGLTLRSSTKGNLSDKKRQHFKKFGPPPYGYCYLDGQLTKDPREYPVLQIISQQWALKKSLVDIAAYLNSKKLKTRSLKIWRPPIILKIVNRLEEESLNQSKGKV